MDTPTIPRRRSIRLQEYNYCQAGAYFLTVCTQKKKCLFGKIIDGEMCLNEAGQMIRNTWQGLSLRFPDIELDEYTIMPNHLHSILTLHGGDLGDRPVQPNGTLPDTIGRIVQAFKSLTTHQYITGAKHAGWPPFPGKLWQRNYWDHVVRNESDLHEIREYIQTNPKRWALDKLFVPY